MSDHNFEKQIRQKLDELKIPPADTVWSSVEAQIRKDKRRRRGLILFPMLLLLMGMGSYFIFENNFSSTNSGSKYVVNSTLDNKDKTANNNNVSKNINDRDKSNNNTDRAEGSLTKEQTQRPGQLEEQGVQQLPDGISEHKQENKTKTSPNQPEFQRADDNHIADKAEVLKPERRLLDNNVPISKRSKVENKIAQDIPRKQDRTEGNLRRESKTKVGNDNKQNEQPNIFNQKPTEQVTSKITENKEEVTAPLKEVKKQEHTISKDQENTPVPGPPANKNSVDAGKNLTDSADRNNMLADNKPADSSTSNAVVEKETKAIKIIKQSSWKWGLTGSAGVSNLNDGTFFDGIIDGIISGEKALVADVSSNAMNNAPSPTAIIYKPSSIEKGFSFSLGAFIQKNLSKRFSLASGLQYSFYSTKIQVGRRVDSTAVLQNAFGSLNVGQYYRSAPVPTTYEYTNRFHFIELPLSANFQLSNRLPVNWNAGLSFSYLISTNALHFDSQTGVYYKDNSLFNKVQANLSTGLSVSLWNKSKIPVHIGPQLQYGLTNLMKRDVSAAKHLFYFGVNTKFFLKK